MRNHRRTATCPTCRQTVKLSRWTGRIKLHVGTAIGDDVFCQTGRFGMRGAA